MRDAALARCLVEGDQESVCRWRRARRKALAASLALEAAAAVLAVLLPLLGFQALPDRVLVTPSPPYPGSGQAGGQRRPHGSHPARDHRPSYIPKAFLAPPRIPSDINRQSDSSDLAEDADRAIGAEGWGTAENILPPLGPPSANPWLRLPPQPPRAPEGRRVARSEDLQQALLIHRVMPAYPALAVQAQMEGTVVLHAIIARDGSVGQLAVVSGSPLLVQAARDAVLKWRYRPTLLHGEPVEVETTITVIFHLER